MKLFLTRALNFDIEILMTWFLLFLEKFFHIKGVLYLKNVVPYLAVFIFDMWSCSSLLPLYGLKNTFIWKKHLIVLEDCHCWKMHVLKFENSSFDLVLIFLLSCNNGLIKRKHIFEAWKSFIYFCLRWNARQLNDH